MTPESDSRPEPFRIDIPDSRLDDLGERLRRTRLAPGPADPAWELGVDRRYMQELIAFWADDYDWRAHEREINTYPQYRVSVGGAPIHFLHVRSPEADALPLILTHGWPWTFWDFRKVIDRLADPRAFGGDPADAFDVVVPSLPGYAFSRPEPEPGMTAWAVADIWHELMTGVLGYPRFAAHGGDMGAHVTAQLGHKFPESLVGIHLSPRPLRLDTFDVDRPWAELLASSAPGPGEPGREAFLAWERKKIGHVVAQTLAPQTLAYGMHDSPAALAAWLLERRRAWSDCGGDLESVYDKDELLTTISLFWLTDSFAAAARQYHDNWAVGWSPEHNGTPVVGTPTGVMLATADGLPGASADWISEYFDLRSLTSLDHGGHFIPEERPEALIEDLRRHFHPLRATAGVSA